MTDLDKTLREILTNWSSGEFEGMDVVSEVKQAFKAAGYDNFRSHATFGESLMTDQEWYDRFQEEFLNIRVDGDPKARFDINKFNEFLDKTLIAAKKASGIEQHPTYNVAGNSELLGEV